MGHIENLRQSLKEMSPDEKLAKIRQIREQRKVFHSPVVEKKKKVAAKKKVDDLKKQLEGLSPDQLAALFG